MRTSRSESAIIGALVDAGPFAVLLVCLVALRLSIGAPVLGAEDALILVLALGVGCDLGGSYATRKMFQWMQERHPDRIEDWRN